MLVGSYAELRTPIVVQNSYFAKMAADLRYPGEDIRPTSDRELRGWYFYGVAAEVFAVCGVGMLSFRAIESTLSD